MIQFNNPFHQQDPDRNGVVRHCQQPAPEAARLTEVTLSLVGRLVLHGLLPAPARPVIAALSPIRLRFGQRADYATPAVATNPLLRLF